VLPGLYISQNVCFLPIGCEGNIICIDNYSMVMHILKELFSDLRISIVNQPKMAYFKCFFQFYEYFSLYTLLRTLICIFEFMIIIVMIGD